MTPTAATSAEASTPATTAAPEPGGGSRAFVLFARLLLLCGAVALAAAGLALAFRDGSAASAAARYECPMHPEISAAVPGECPICRMSLELHGAAQPAPIAPAPIAPAPAAASSAPQAFVCPMHPQITAAAPGRCSLCKMDLVPSGAKPPKKSEVRLSPVISADYAPGALWLPETSPPSEALGSSNGPVLGTPKRRVFVDDVRASAWLEAPDRLAVVLYRDELIGLTPGERGAFFRASAPRKPPIHVRLSDAAPERWDASTSVVRFVVEPEAAAEPGAGRARAERELEVGAVGWLELPDRSRELLAFPASALLRSDTGPYVLVPRAGSFERRPVEIGRTLKGFVVVLGGISEGESIVIGNAFLLDAEQRLKPSPIGVAGVSP